MSALRRDSTGDRRCKWKSNSRPLLHRRTFRGTLCIVWLVAILVKLSPLAFRSLTVILDVLHDVRPRCLLKAFAFLRALDESPRKVVLATLGIESSTILVLA
jgi:hypothetical protein